MVVKAFLIVSVASFHFSIVPWRTRSNQLVNDLLSRTLNIHRVDHFCLFEMGKLSSVVCLNYLRKVSETGGRSANEVHRRVAADFFV